MPASLVRLRAAATTARQDGRNPATPSGRSVWQWEARRNPNSSLSLAWGRSDACRLLRQPRQQRLRAGQELSTSSGVDTDVVVDPLDTFVMSDTRWEDLDLELPTERLDRAELPEDAPVPDWVRRPPPTARDARSRAGLAEGALRSMPACVGGLRRGGLYGAYLVAVRSWVLRTLREYDVVFARGAGPAWCALARVRCIAQTYGGDITIAPFLDQPSFAGAEHAPASTASREDRAVARLQRHGLQRSERVLLFDPDSFHSQDVLG